MTESPIPLNEENGPIRELFQLECTGVVVLTRQVNGRTIDYAPMTFLRIGRPWYRISLRDQSVFCTLDRPNHPNYLKTDNGYAYKHTDVSHLIYAENTRATDFHAYHGINYTWAVLNFTNGRALGFRQSWDSGRTQLWIM